MIRAWASLSMMGVKFPGIRMFVCMLKYEVRKSSIFIHYCSLPKLMVTFHHWFVDARPLKCLVHEVMDELREVCRELGLEAPCWCWNLYLQLGRYGYEYRGEQLVEANHPSLCPTSHSLVARPSSTQGPRHTFTPVVKWKGAHANEAKVYETAALGWVVYDLPSFSQLC